jgi:hypothetical protein
VVARLIEIFGRLDPGNALEVGKTAPFVQGKSSPN